MTRVVHFDGRLVTRPLAPPRWLKPCLAVLAALLSSGAAAAPLIAVDVGHSQRHPGATSASGVAEFTFNRRLATLLAPVLAAHGLHSMTIGASGQIDRLATRSRLADQAHASFLLSLHHDAVQPQFRPLLLQGHGPDTVRFAGFSLFVSHRNVDPGASLRCASAIGQALIDAGFTPSTYHGEPVPGEGYQIADARHGVYYHDDLAVLGQGHQPAALLEAGVIVNPIEERALSRPSQQRRMVEAITRGLVACQTR